jgi:alpha-1,2-mannosyltransferase
MDQRSWWLGRAPTWLEVFITLLFIRSFAAIYAPISDCDEVFNYWEPTHLMLEGYGFQTWEYRLQ